MGVTSEDIAICENVLQALLQDEALLASGGLRTARVLMAQLVDKLRKGTKREQNKSQTGMRLLPYSETCKPWSSLSVCEVKPAQFSRLMYANPVCLLSSGQDANRNLMTISWLTALDNRGHILLSVNKRRHSAANILTTGMFVLNVPTAELAPTVLEIGGCSGRDVDKIKQFQADLGGYCLPGWQPLAANEEAKEKLFAIGACVAHLVVQVLQALPDVPHLDSHHIVVCRVMQAFVRTAYWDGKIFAPRNHEETLTPPYMSFFGSQTFGYIYPSLFQNPG